MSAKIAERIVKDLDERIQEHKLGNPFFKDSSYRIFPLSEHNFKAIVPISNERKMAFVDGGNQEILGAADFSVQVNRVYYSVFEGKRRVLGGPLPNKIEFFSTTLSSFKEDEIFYDTLLFPIDEVFGRLLPDGRDLKFSSTDRTVMVGTMRADISRVASIARRFAEWSFAYHVVDMVLREGDILVLDGTLQTAFTNESRYSERLYEKAISKGIVVVGLSKTCGLFTDTGISLLGAVGKLADDSGMGGTWYFPIAESTSSDHDVVIYVVKLNPGAEHIFRFEVYRKQVPILGERGINEVMNKLAENSQDVSFPGYPYGLIDADLFSRVRDEEVEGYRALLLSEISKIDKWDKFARRIHAVDAHGLLNMLVR